MNIVLIIAGAGIIALVLTFLKEKNVDKKVAELEQKKTVDTVKLNELQTEATNLKSKVEAEQANLTEEQKTKEWQDLLGKK